MAKVNADVKKIVSQVKTAQAQLERLMKDRTWVEEVRKYAEKQKGDVRRLLQADAQKVKAFLERERKTLEKFQKEIPGELNKLAKLVQGQRKEFTGLLNRIRKNVAGKPAAAKKTAKKSAPRKRKAAPANA